ncbi:MAG: hypothetical protein IJI92_00835 [Erysipelotrichaceae bacterium]|nr:hypothetical protein [Erysipelotrichaceae bacterium]
MKSILDSLSSAEAWQEFRLHKKEKRQLSRKQSDELDLFIEQKRYLKITSTFEFSYPEKKIISKMGSDKKRIVYSYSKDETWVLKLLAYQLYCYDGLLSDCCCSFRRNKTAKTAFDEIRKIKDLDQKYVLKLDIHNYFNSIDADILMEILKKKIDDERLLSFFDSLLHQDRCLFEGQEITEKRGAMAGVPLASFFANFYLLDLDEHFETEGTPYFRYSDDLIAFFDSEEERERGFEFISEFLKEKKLELNMDKYMIADPGEAWEFLGFSYHDGEIDLAEATITKMKGKIRRKARKLYRYRKLKHLSYEKAARAMISSFDHKFYDFTGNNDFTWIRFYFPLITVSTGLHKIDEHMVRYLRYLSSGHHNRSNYKITYEQLKSYGYTPLVAEYYRWRKENRELSEKREDII